MRDSRALALALALLAIGCKSRDPATSGSGANPAGANATSASPTGANATSSTASFDAGVMPFDAAPGDRDAAPSDAARRVDAVLGTLGDGGPRFAIAPTTKQLVTAITADWDATSAELRLWTRAGTAWKQVGTAWRAVIGHTGAAWGVGLHGRGAPVGHAGPIKREGDGKSPAGVFDLTSAFGYATAAPTGSRIGYQQVDTNWKCVDDPASRAYNRILDARTTTVDWKSAEEMRRSDDAYAWVVEVAHNPSRTREDGSCIFLHVWSGPDSSTLGCTAMEEPHLASLIAKLAPDDRPAFVLLPRAEYAALADAWDLPR